MSACAAVAVGVSRARLTRNSQGYSPLDIASTLFRVVKNFQDIPELLRLEYCKVRRPRHIVDASKATRLTSVAGNWQNARACA